MAPATTTTPKASYGPSSGCANVGVLSTMAAGANAKCTRRVGVRWSEVSEKSQYTPSFFLNETRMSW